MHMLHQLVRTNYVNLVAFLPCYLYICNMGEYALKTKDGETINKVFANSYDKAVKLIAQLKKLKQEELLKIYVVEKVS